ncbi:MAG: S8 family serine peptidase, partial [Ignisphaera sp.]
MISRKNLLASIAIVVLLYLSIVSHFVMQSYRNYNNTSDVQAGWNPNFQLPKIKISSDEDILNLGEDIEGLNEGETLSVTLITGDSVTILKKDGKISVAIDAVDIRKNFYVFPKGNTIYVVPEDVDLKKFDIELFNIRLLADHINMTRGRIPLIIKVRNNVPLEHVVKRVEKTTEELKELKHRNLEIISSVALRVPIQEREKVLKTLYKVLANDSSIDKIVLDRIHRVSSKGEDIGIQLYESIPLMSIPDLWNIDINGSGYTIAVLDTGIDPNHPDFYIDGETKIVAMESFVDFDFDDEADESPIDGHGHGTHCAGTAAGVGGYLDIVRGVAPGANLIIGKVLSNLGYGHDSWIIEGIEWAVENGADVISMSLGGSATLSYDPLVAAVNWAVEQGVVVVVAAGNSGPSYFTIASPGVASKAITVGAVDKELNIAEFSSRGPTPNATLKPDVVAPGVYIASSRAWKTYMDEPASIYHVYASGTSMATPHVAGYATLVLQLLGEYGILNKIVESLGVNRAEVVKDIIISTALDLDLDPFTQGAGFVEASKLLELLLNEKLVIVHPARIDVVAFENTIEVINLTLYNPFNEDVSITVDLEFKPWISLMYDPVGDDIVVVDPQEVTIPANSSINVSLSIDFSQIPTGYHALILKIISSDTEIGKALVGISKPQILAVSASFEGTPEPIFVYATGFSPALGQSLSLYGYDWGWIGYSYEGEVILYPLYPDTIYLIEIASLINPYIVYTVISTDNVTNIYSLEIDFAEVEPTYITTANELQGYAFVSYGINMMIRDPANNIIENITYSDGTLIYLYPSESAEIRYGIIDGFSTPNYIIELNSGYFGIKAETYTDRPELVWVFYRVYTSVPINEYIVVEPKTVNVTLYHVHSAISDDEVIGKGALFLFGGVVDLDSSIYRDTPYPSYTVYLVDTNVTLSLGRALDKHAIQSEDGDTLNVLAYQFHGLNIDGGYLYAPLASPLAGTTIWSYSMLLEGLDSHNFTYGFGRGHTFRSTFTKSYSIYSQIYPISYALLTINNESIIEMFDTYALTYYLEGFNWNNTELAKVRYDFTLDLSRYPLIKVSNHVRSSSVSQFNEPNYTAYEKINAFGYGVGVRDILIVGEFDYLYNYLPENASTYMYLFINRPVDGNFALTKHRLTLIGYTDGSSQEIELPLNIVSTGPSYYIGLVEINSQEILLQASPGPFDLVVNLLYNNSLTGDTINYELYIDNAIYIGTSVYTPVTPTPTVPTTTTVTVPTTTTVTVPTTTTVTVPTTTTVTVPTTTTVTVPTTTTVTVP